MLAHTLCPQALRQQKDGIEQLHASLARLADSLAEEQDDDEASAVPDTLHAALPKHEPAPGDPAGAAEHTRKAKELRKKAHEAALVALGMQHAAAAAHRKHEPPPHPTQPKPHHDHAAAPPHVIQPKPHHHHAAPPPRPTQPKPHHDHAGAASPPTPATDQSAQ